jgi:hypothetical protein
VCRTALYARGADMTEPEFENVALWVVAVLLLMAPWALL